MKTLAILFSVLLISACAKADYGAPDSLPTAGKPSAGQFDNCEFNFAKAGFCASLRWIKPATDQAAGEFSLSFWRPGATTLSDPGNTVFALLWMKSMGHGSSPTQVVREGVGSYRVQNVFFVMPGTWDIRIQLKNGAQVLDEASVPFAYQGGE